MPVQEQNYAIKNWSAEDRPREKLRSLGAERLSTAELLAILLRSGTRRRTALDLARDLLEQGKGNLQELGKLSVPDIMKIKGIGETKAITLVAALELGRRRHAGLPLGKTIIRNSHDTAEFLRTRLKDYTVEKFAVLFLNRANKVNHFQIVSEGGITGTVADPRHILKTALDHQAVSLILCHNHPSGSLRPSRADEELTRKIAEAARLLDMTVLDHLIVSEEGYYSFADEGLL